MSRWIDIADDVSKKFYHTFTGKVNMPEYVKSAGVPTSEEMQGLSSSAFADPIGRKFAVNTKSNCWCSALYFYGNQCNGSEYSKQAETKLLQAARIWGIASDIEQVKQAFQVTEVPVTYAISFQFNNRQINRCPDHTKQAATHSAEWLYENRYHFPVAVQQAAAAKLAAKADVAKLSSKTANYLDRLANPEHYSNLNCKVATAITDRLSRIPMGKWGELEDSLLKVAEAINAAPFEICKSAEVLVSAIEAVDVKHNMQSKWGSGFMHPVDVCYRANLTKVAAAVDSTVYLTTGTPIDITNISDSQLAHGLKIAGDEFLSYCQPDGLNVDRAKAAEILPTLPKPEARRFETAVKKAGYSPESAYDLVDRLFKEAQMDMGYGMPMPAQPMSDTEMLPGEDDAAFEARMNDKKEQAKLDGLDAQAGLAACKARQARQQYEQGAMNQQMSQAQGMQA
jgi:hypothetical protein